MPKHRQKNSHLYAILGVVVAVVVGTSIYIALPDTDEKLPTAPGEVIDLTNWKLTLPIDTSDEEGPDEVKQPNLATYSSEFFHLNKTRDGVVFRATAGGSPTKGSSFARTELREMGNGGYKKGLWVTGDIATHTMSIRQAVTALPTARPSMVVGQVHGGDEYGVLIRLDGTELYVKTSNDDAGIIDPRYQLGTPFDLKLVAHGNVVDIYYNGQLKFAVPQDCNDGCYFKAGAYLQSNTEYGDAPDAYGEVEIYRLSVTHNNAE